MHRRPFKDLLWTRLDARAGTTAVIRLELHRHLPETAKLGAHSHAHWQALLYLSGHGVQQIGRSVHPVSAGSLVILPPRSRHSFRREAGQPPLCLMLDFRATWQKRTATRSLAAFEIARVRSVLADMARLSDDKRTPDEIGRASLALRLLAQIAEASGWYPKPVRHSAMTVLHQVQKHLENGARPRTVAAALGYHPDYLSRLVRAETGLGLGGLAAQVRLQRAQRLLLKHGHVRDAAAEAGFFDQNYFARWFKKQTGLTPLGWKSGRSPLAAKRSRVSAKRG